MLNKFFIQICKFVFYFSLKFNLYKLMAFFLFLSIRKLKKIKYSNKIKKKKILILEKSFGIDEIKITYSRKKSDFHFFVLQRSLLSFIFNFYFKNLKLNNSDYKNKFLKDKYYELNNFKINEAKVKLRNTYYNIFLELNKYFKIDCVISFNFFYRAEKELRVLDEKLGIKFIIIQKESNLYQKEIDSFKKILKVNGKFKGTKILFFSNFMKNLFLNSDVIKNSQAEVVGTSKLDLLFNSKKSKKNTILIFLMQPFRVFFDENKKSFNSRKLKAEILIFDTLKVILNLARKYKKINFIFKAKVSADIRLKSQINLINRANLTNCKLVLIGASQKLIKDAKIIIGFNTTALLEGLVAGKFVIMPYFDSYIKKFRGFVMKTNKSIIKPRSPEMLEKNISNLINHKKEILKKNTLNSSDKKLINYYCGNPDGKSSERLNLVLKKILSD